MDDGSWVDEGAQVENDERWLLEKQQVREAAGTNGIIQVYKNCTVLFSRLFFFISKFKVVLFDELINLGLD